MIAPDRPRTVPRMTWCVCILTFLLGFAPAALAQSSNYTLGPQDKLRVKAFEWRPSRDEIFTWEALNDEYVVGADGNLMLPLVGDVKATGVTTSALAGVIAQRLKTGLGLVSPPDISVEIVLFRPFYITGQVEKPGEYPFRPGLTVAQAVAIAGGVSRNRELGILRLEREVISTEGEIRALRIERDNLEARRARLESELANAEQPTFPDHLVADDRNETVQAALRQERLIFAAREDAFKTQTAALLQLKEHLKKELTSLDAQMQMEDRQIALVKRELQGLMSLVEKGLATAPRQIALERTLAAAESDKLKMSVSILKAHQEIAKAEIGLLELKNKRANDVTVELRDTQAKLDAVLLKEATAKQLLEETEISSPLLINRNRTRPQPTYAITRADSPEAGRVAVGAGDAVRPGDTLDVEIVPPDLVLPARRQTGEPGARAAHSTLLSRN